MGFSNLKLTRNKAQAEHLDPSRAVSKQSLFDDAQPVVKKARRTRDELAEKRDNPSTCEVLLDNGVAVWLERPVLDCDPIVIKFTESNVRSVLEYIVAGGINMDNMYTRRAYTKRTAEDAESASSADAEELPDADTCEYSPRSAV